MSLTESNVMVNVLTVGGCAVHLIGHKKKHRTLKTTPMPQYSMMGPPVVLDSVSVAESRNTYVDPLVSTPGLTTRFDLQSFKSTETAKVTYDFDELSPTFKLYISTRQTFHDKIRWLQSIFTVSHGLAQGQVS